MNKHCGIAAVVGRANVGKSSLMNRILGEKVAIVSGVAQTTRNLVRGVLSDARGQLVLLDTPGIHRAAGSLGRLLNKKARGALEGADVVLLVLDRSVPPQPEDEGWMRRLLFAEVPLFLVVNKLDRPRDCRAAYERMWEALRARQDPPIAAEWLTVSARDGTGVDELVARVFAALPEGAPLFEEDMLSDYPRKLAMADCIREKLFEHLRNELPHQVGVWVESIDETDAGWQARALIYVNKPSQKPIVLGAKGRTLRRVRRAAAAELGGMYDVDLNLDLWVKVEKNWIENFWILRRMDLVE